MTLNQLKSFYEKIIHFSQPEELFGDLGSLPGGQLHQLEITFRSLMQSYHPDFYTRRPSELYCVTEIAKSINVSHQPAMSKIKAGSYGCEYKGLIQTSRHDYFVTDLLVESAFTDIYRGYYLDRQSTMQPRRDVVIKIISDPARNPLIDREAAFYQTLAHFCFPGYVENLGDIEEPRPSEAACKRFPRMDKWREHAALFLYIQCEKPKVED